MWEYFYIVRLYNHKITNIVKKSVDVSKRISMMSFTYWTLFQCEQWNSCDEFYVSNIVSILTNKFFDKFYISNIVSVLTQKFLRFELFLKLFWWCYYDPCFALPFAVRNCRQSRSHLPPGRDKSKISDLEISYRKSIASSK